MRGSVVVFGAVLLMILVSAVLSVFLAYGAGQQSVVNGCPDRPFVDSLGETAPTVLAEVQTQMATRGQWRFVFWEQFGCYLLVMTQAKSGEFFQHIFVYTETGWRYVETRLYFDPNAGTQS